MIKLRSFFILVLIVSISGPLYSGQVCQPCRNLAKCTSALFGRGVTADSSVIMAHQEDYGDNDCMHVVHHPRQTYAPGTLINFSYVTLPQVTQTFAYTSDDMYDPARLGFPGPAAFMNGINEYGVTLSSNCFESKEPFPPLEGGLSWSEIGQLCMERCTTSRHAVDLATQLVDTYHFNGFEASACKNLTFVIADDKEGWIVEVTSRHWVARRCPDNGAIFYTNQAQIDTTWDLASSDLIEYAAQMGWYDPESGTPFNFKQVYCHPYLGYRMNVIREQRMQTLLAPKLGSITVQDCFAFWRDHHEGTSDYFLPHTVPTTTWANPDLQYPVCAAWTHSSEIYHLRGKLPKAIGSVMWICPSTPCCAIYTPVYAGNREATPAAWTTGIDVFTPGSAWWTFESIQRKVAGYENTLENWQTKWTVVRSAFDLREQRQFKRAGHIERAALNVWNSGNQTQALSILSDFTNDCLQKNHKKAKKLLRQVETN